MSFLFSCFQHISSPYLLYHISMKKYVFSKKVLVLNPYPQTPFPRKGAEYGAAALTPLGATPQTPFLKLCRFCDNLKAELRLCLSVYVLLFAFSAFFAIVAIITTLARRTVAGATAAVSDKIYDHEYKSQYYQCKQNDARYIHFIHNFTLCNTENHSDTADKECHYPGNTALYKYCCDG